MSERLDAMSRRRERLLVLALFALGAILRMWRFGSVPGGLNQDEAYAAYEALCLLETGADSWGYAFPVYFRSWGSGMNVLESYLMMPLVAVFGLQTWVIRLPQLIVALATMPVFYALMRRLTTRRFALMGLFLLAVCPWHVMLSRWGLESNLAPGLMLMGTYCFVRGVDDAHWFLPCAAFFGLSLYAYATIWPVVPAMLLLLLAALIRAKRLVIGRWLAAAVALLAVLAAPLIAFVLVNMGLIPEIRTPFLSVPSLLSMRTYDFGANGLYENLYDMVFMMLRQRDDTLWNATREFGLYYHLSLPLMVVGGVRGLIETLSGFKKREWRAVMPVMVQLLCAVVLGLFVEANVNRLNCIHFPAIILTVLGLETFCGWFGRHAGKAGFAAAAAYGVMAVLFAGFYFGEYADRIAEKFHQGFEEAVVWMNEQTGEEESVAVSPEILYPKLLVTLETPANDFRAAAIVHADGTEAFIDLERLGRWRFDMTTARAAEEEMALIAPLAAMDLLELSGWQIAVFDTVFAAIPPAGQ